MINTINLDGVKYVDLSDVINEMESVHNAEKDNGFDAYSAAVKKLITDLKYGLLYY